MGLNGDLLTMELSEVLQWISVGRKTGTLHLRRRSIEKGVVFSNGTISSSWSNDPRESLGQFLIRGGRIGEEQLFRALLRQEDEGRLLGSILVDAGLLSEEDLRQTLKAKAEETIYDLFLWSEGRFEFLDGEVPQGALVQVDMGVTNVILEGVRRVDEWKRIKDALPSTGTTFRATASTSVVDPFELQALALAAAGRSLAEIALELRRSEFDAASLLFDLLGRGLVTVDRVSEEHATTDTIQSIKELLALAGDRLTQRRHEAATRAYESVLALDRLNQKAKKGLKAVEEALAKEREGVERLVSLDRIPVLAMDLASLTRQMLDPQEGFVLSRVNGQWDVQSILKICPLTEEDTLLIFARLLERGLIELR